MCFLKSSEQNWVNEAQHAAPHTHTHINRFMLLFIANTENFVFSNLIFVSFFCFSISALPPVFSDGTDHSDHQHSSHLPNLMSTSFSDSEPEFVEQVPNVTVSVGRDAKFPCKVNKLDTYRVSSSFCFCSWNWKQFLYLFLLLSIVWQLWSASGQKRLPLLFFPLLLCARSINVRLIDTIETLYTCTHILSPSWNIFCFFFPFPPSSLHICMCSVFRHCATFVSV